MRVLIVGSGSREYTLAKELKKLPNLDMIFVAPGNEAIKEIANCIDIAADKIDEILEFAKVNEINLTITFDEKAINNGITEAFNNSDIMIFAPTKESTRIIASKAICKKFMYKTKIPTAKFAVLDKENLAIDYVRNSNYPLVIKRDSHLDSTPSVVCHTFHQAKREVELAFIYQNKKIIIEDYIEGQEYSFYVITDGYNAVPLMACVPYKYSLEFNGGAITSGMGAYAPASKIDEQMQNKILNRLIYPALKELAQNDNPYLGILGVDFKIDAKENLYALEYNSCINEPEFQCMMALLNVNLLNLMNAAIVGSLADDYGKILTLKGSAVSMVMSAPNYDKLNIKNSVIEGLNDLDDGVSVSFYNAKKNEYLEHVVTGKRVLILTSRASTLAHARDKLYENAELIRFQGKKYINDIAKIKVGE